MSRLVPMPAYRDSVVSTQKLHNPTYSSCNSPGHDIVPSGVNFFCSNMQGHVKLCHGSSHHSVDYTDIKAWAAYVGKNTQLHSVIQVF